MIIEITAIGMGLACLWQGVKQRATFELLAEERAKSRKWEAQAVNIQMEYSIFRANNNTFGVDEEEFKRGYGCGYNAFQSYYQLMKRKGKLDDLKHNDRVYKSRMHASFMQGDSWEYEEKRKRRESWEDDPYRGPKGSSGDDTNEEHSSNSRTNFSDTELRVAMNFFILSAGYTKKELKVSYRRLSKAHHPDYNNNSEASNKKMAQINEQYKILKDNL